MQPSRPRMMILRVNHRVFNPLWVMVGEKVDRDDHRSHRLAAGKQGKQTWRQHRRGTLVLGNPNSSEALPTGSSRIVWRCGISSRELSRVASGVVSRATGFWEWEQEKWSQRTLGRVK